MGQPGLAAFRVYSDNRENTQKHHLNKQILECFKQYSCNFTPNGHKPIKLIKIRRMKGDKVYILGIESSCDDTSCAILENEVLLSNITANQKIHEQYGGVVPELASRDHQKNIVPTVQAALEKAGVNLSQISAIAFTRGPGLMGSLLKAIRMILYFIVNLFSLSSITSITENKL